MTITPKFSDYTKTTLEQKLAALNIPVIPDHEVIAHKRETVLESRAGVWRFLFPIPVLCVRSCDLFNRDLRVYLAVFAVCASVGGAFGWQLGNVYQEWSGVLFTAGIAVGFLIPFTLSMLYDILDQNHQAPAFFAAGQYWQVERHALDLAALTRIKKCPRHILNRALVLTEVFDYREAKLVTERFGRDPLIYIEHEGQRVCFGAWDTHTHLDSY